jgi:hypothetical protein
MNTSATRLQTSPDETAALPAIRQLSTAQQSEWIERIFNRLSAIYGSEFTHKWSDVDNDEMKRTWASILGGFSAEDIAAAIKACHSLPKAPNAPEFAALCRQHMTARTKVELKPLTADERKAVQVVSDKVAEGFRTKEEAAKEYWINGVLITKYRQWAVNLVKREAGGEQLEISSTEAWREVLNNGKDADAKTVLADVIKAESMMKEAA